MSQRLREYLQLTRPRIVMMVLFTLAVAAWCCGNEPPQPWELIHALLGTALITAGSVAMNQWYEWRSDALMERTRHRPIPTGRIASHRGLIFALSVSVLGLTYLALCSSHLVAAVALLNWVFYVLCYTPLKALSVWQLPVGSIAGAMPIVIGGAVAEAPLSPLTLILFGVLFCWQFPHAIAIAWIYRDHYARANLQVTSVRDPSGRLSGVLAVAGALALLPVSLLPALLHLAHPLFAVVAAVAGTAYLVPSIQFLACRTDQTARKMLWTSFLYLPAILCALLWAT